MIYPDDIYDKLCNIYDFNDKERCIRHEVNRMSLRCSEMFDYDNLPSSIDKKNLELWTQSIGFTCITDKPDGVVRVFFCSLGAGYTPNYRPEKVIVTNPWLKTKNGNTFQAELKVIWEKGDEGDCVILLNDSFGMGLMPLHRKYATMIVENELSIKVADILARFPTILTADDEDTRKSAERFLENIIEGKLGIVQDTAFLEGLKDVQFSNQTHMLFHGLIENEQYFNSRWFGEIGLNSMFNLKKEAISDAEKSMNEDELIPLSDNMMYERVRTFDIANERFGLDVKPKFNSSWADNRIEIYLEQKIMEAEANGSEEQNGSVADSSGPAESTEESSGGSDNTDGEGKENEQPGSDIQAPEDSTTVGSDSVTPSGDNINVEVTVNLNKDEGKEDEISEEERKDS